MNRLILVAVAYVLASCHDRHTLTGSFEGLANDTLLVYGWPVASRPESALPWRDTITAASGRIAYDISVTQPTILTLTPLQLIAAGCDSISCVTRNASVLLYLDRGDRTRIHACLRDSTVRYRVHGSQECEAVAAAEALWRDDAALHSDAKDEPVNPFRLAQAATVPSHRKVAKHKPTEFRRLIASRKNVRTSVPKPDDDVVPPNWDSLESYYISLARYVGRLFTRPIEEIRDRREATERTARENRTRTVPGTPAPPLRLPTIHGGDFSLDFNRGECTVLHFWTSGCQSCTDDFPDMKRAWDRYHDRVYFISIGCGESRQAWKKAVRRYALPWLNLYDDARTNVSARYGVETYPTKFIIDRAGIILEREDDDPTRFYMRLDSIMTAQQPLAAQ